MLGYLCVSLADKSRLCFDGHYIKVTVGQLGTCAIHDDCALKRALYSFGVGSNQILLGCQAQSGFLGMG